MERVGFSMNDSILRNPLLVAAAAFLALFFVEYPPLFLVGYWSWSGDVHKVLSGFFLILNLVIALQVRRMLESSKRARALDT